MENDHHFPSIKKSIFKKKRIGKDFIEADSGFIHISTSQNCSESMSNVKNDLAVIQGHGEKHRHNRGLTWIGL